MLASSGWPLKDLLDVIKAGLFLPTGVPAGDIDNFLLNTVTVYTECCVSL